jgi:regulator of protease activity HflC (stomatin/prohibitin superfamily)
MKTTEVVFGGTKLKGIPVLILNILLLIGICVFFGWCISTYEEQSGLKIALLIVDTILFLLNTLIWSGFMQIEPNEARVMVFFGEYEGTVKENGFFWVNPFYTKKKLTLRARNLDAEPIKVNDKTGNPILIGLVLVWRVRDTYKAAFNIDSSSESPIVKAQNGTIIDGLGERMKSYEKFVKVQSDAALRSVAGMYAYDQTGTADAKDLTLRSAGDEVTDILEIQLNERLSIAGIEVIEARINYLAYAPEIAAVMLRRQQADAIISARSKIVDGAVGMVKMALDKLADEKILELDEDKKAAMVSNLLVVLCSEEATQPVINAGTLNH